MTGPAPGNGAGMGFRFERDEAVAVSARRIAGEQLGKAQRSLDGADAERFAAAVHDCRKRCKKVRGLVRLVRPGLGGEYHRANAACRDAARSLAPFRDAHALAATFDHLVVAATGRDDPGALGPVRSGLVDAAARATERARSGSDGIERALDLLARADARRPSWPLDGSAGWDVVAGGLGKTYGRGRRALQEARAAPSAARFHEWRKRAKYTGYHLRLLHPAAPSVLDGAGAAFSTLADTLGDAHDLAVLAATLRADPSAYGGDEVVGSAAVLADGLRVQLERRALSLGARLYAEPAAAFVARMGRYWDVWHRLGDELEGGDLQELFPVRDEPRPLAVTGAGDGRP